MKSSKIATAALAAIAMLGASSAFAATPAVSKLSLTSAQSLRVGGVEKRAASRQNRVNFLANPLVIAGIVATAIAVPVALANSTSSSP